MRFTLEYPVISNEYSTEVIETSWFPTSFPTPVFYWKIGKIILKAASLSKKGIYTDAEWSKSSYGIFKAIEEVGGHITVNNLNPLLNQPGPAVVIGNHMSTLETFILPFLICPHKKVTFVIKEGLTTYPVFKHIMNSRNPVVVGRENPKKDFINVIKEGTERLANGYTIIVFPQTTRMQEFDRTQFNSIGVKLAKNAGVPVVPLALKTDFWGNGNLIKEFGKITPAKKVRFDFGNPLAIEGNGKNQQELIVAHIENCLNEWNEPH